MSFFLPFSFLSPFFKLRERESIQLQYLGRVEGENGFKVYFAFRRVSSESISFFYGQAGFFIAWLEGTLSSCPILFPLFPRVSVTVSIHLVTPTAVLKLGSASLPGVVATISTPLVTPTAVLKLHSSFLFPLMKKLLPFLGFWPIIPLFSPCQAIHSDY